MIAFINLTVLKINVVKKHIYLKMIQMKKCYYLTALIYKNENEESEIKKKKKKKKKKKNYNKTKKK